MSYHATAATVGNSRGEREMAQHPERISPFTVEQQREATTLVEHIEVDLDGDLGNDYEMP